MRQRLIPRRRLAALALSALAAIPLAPAASAQTVWERNVAAEPPESLEVPLAFDSRRGVTVYYGGFPTAETWEYDGTTWAQVVTTHSPGDRLGHAMTYDSGRRVVVLHGGFEGTTHHTDTWEYDGNDWTVVATIGTPPPRTNPELVYDPVERRCLLIGGRLGLGSNETQTWEYDGATGTWSQIPTPVSPTSVWEFWIAYDSWNHRTLLYGGADGSFVEQDQLWQFDNATDTWSELTSVAGPGYRRKGQGAFDELRGVFVVYGGNQAGGGGHYQDTWEYDVSTGLWAEHLASAGPTVRADFGAAYDSRRARIVLMGTVGNGSSNRQTWEFGGGVTTSAFCFGDGTSALPCPCGNDASPGAGTGCRNSQGHGASIGVTGSTVVAADDAVLHVAGARPHAPSLLLQGSDRVVFPFKDGILCMGNPTARLEVVALDAAGSGNTVTSISSTGGVAPGTVHHYQFWYRDPQVSPCGSGSNFTNAVSLYWQ